MAMERRFQHCDDSPCGLSVAKDIGGLAHPLVGARVGEQAIGFADDSLCVGAHQFQGAGFDAFLTLGLVAQDKDGFAKGGRFFLYAAGIRDDEKGVLEAGEELLVIQRLAEDDV